MVKITDTISKFGYRNDVYIYYSIANVIALSGFCCHFTFTINKERYFYFFSKIYTESQEE